MCVCVYISYHVVITYFCLGACCLSLYLITSDLLFNRFFPLYELISSFSFRRYMVGILLRYSKLLLE